MKEPNNSKSKVHFCWFLLVFLVAASFVSTLTNISQGLHEQLSECKENLFTLNDELIVIGEDKMKLQESKIDEETKSSRLREKAKTVLDELLSQQKKVKALQYELLGAKDGLNTMIHNCSGSSKELSLKFNLTLDVLKDKVTSNIQYRSLLKRTLEEKLKAETTLETMQYSLFNVTQELKKYKNQLVLANEVITKQNSEIYAMQDQVAKANEAMNRAAQVLKENT